MDWLAEIAKKKERLIIGTMSGTSTDGIDVVMIKISGSRLDTRFEMLAFDTFPYPSNLRQRIFMVYPPNRFTGEEIARLSFDIAELQAQSINTLIESSGYSQDDVDLICMYGLTLYHGTPDREKGITGAHIEIGEPAVIKERTGITTIADLRINDIVMHGEGAPLCPYMDWVVFRDEYLGSAIQNIGGIANVTGIPPKAGLDDVIAFDTGPGNMVIDGIVKMVTNGEKTYDSEGQMAAQGTVNGELLEGLMQFPYILRDIPKTTGRELFGDQFCKPVYEKACERGIHPSDLVATATAYTAETIANAYRRFLTPRFRIDRVVLTGGGVHNNTLVRMLSERLAPIPVYKHEDFGINSDAREAIAWAIMGNEIIQGKTPTVPSATGAKRAVLTGKLLPGHKCIKHDQYS